MTTETAAPTTAQVIAGLLDNDGQRFRPIGNDATLDELARAVGGRQTFRDGHGTDTYRWDFKDGSAICVAGDGWDFPLAAAEPGCYCWEGCGRHLDNCPCAATVDWSADAYRKAPGGSLEYWQYLAACYIHVSSQHERDRLALAVGRRCFEAAAKGENESVWHQTTELLREENPSRDYMCPCATCSARAH